jgi:hypothetical protein
LLTDGWDSGAIIKSAAANEKKTQGDGRETKQRRGSNDKLDA